MQIYLQAGVEAKTDWTNDSSEMKRSGIERIVSTKGADTNDNFIFLVAMRLGETPVHIPNTMVKTQTADDTMLETAWESRWLPD